MFALLLMFPLGIGVTVLGANDKNGEKLEAMAFLMFGVPILLVVALLSGPGTAP